MLPRSGREFSSPPTTKLPAEILYLIAELASFETRAKLVRCNKWLCESCTPLLYRDIYLRSPIQLINLSQSQKAMQHLERTESLFIDEIIYSSREWQGIPRHHNPVEYLLYVLRAAVSLHRLQVLGSEEHDLLVDNNIFTSEVARGLIREAVDNPEFLPKLSLLINDPTCTDLDRLRYARPILYCSSWNSVYLTVEIFPSLDPSGPEALSISDVVRSQLASSASHDLSAKEVGQLIQETTAPSSRLTLTLLVLKMRSPYAIINNNPSPLGNCLDWIQTMLSAADCPKIDSLFLEFQPTPPFQPATAQYSTLKRLQQMSPKLVRAQFSYPDLYWTREGPREGQALPRPDLAGIDWTPEPSQSWIGEVLTWWANALGINISGTHNQELNRTAARLRDGMLVWWDEHSVASKVEIFEALLARSVANS